MYELSDPEKQFENTITHRRVSRPIRGVMSNVYMDGILESAMGDPHSRLLHKLVCGLNFTEPVSAG